MSIQEVFHKSIIGASHIALNKPCQDYSISFEQDGIQIAVVCDGHGGSTYVRSDRGAKMVAEITEKNLFHFGSCKSDDKSIFVNESFSITAKPRHNPFIDIDGNTIAYDDLDETRKRYADQAKLYIEVEKRCPAQQEVVNDLIKRIYDQWRSEIDQDIREHPLTEEEQKLLGGEDITKAYGCTLLAFLKTDWYWLAFQIGDGSICCCDKNLSWSKPVPEDCRCFLNYTTSLCDSNPLSEFRYAFSGIGDSPLAIFLCSDGVDGSLGTEERLFGFYEQIIDLYLDDDDINEELKEYLPTLSERGSRDDMSLAGIIDLRGLDKIELKKIIESKEEKRKIENEIESKETEIRGIKTRIETLRIKHSAQDDSLKKKQREFYELCRNDVLSRKFKEIIDLKDSIYSIEREIKDLEKGSEEKDKELKEYVFITKNDIATLEENQNNH